MDIKPEIKLVENEDMFHDDIVQTIERELTTELNTQSVDGYDEEIDTKDNDFDEDEFKDEDDFE